MKEAINRAKIRPNRLISIVFCGLLGLTIMVVLLVSPGLSVVETFWRDYYVLLVDAEAGLGPVLDTLERAQVDHVSPRNTKVYINNFSNIEAVPLSQIDSRLDRGDPRYDPYIASLREFFTGYYRANTWHVIYLHADSALIVTRIRLAILLGPLGIEYRMPEWSFFWFLFAPLVFGLYVLMLARRRGKQRMWIMLSALPLLILSLRGPRLGFAGAVLMLPGWLSLAAGFFSMYSDYVCTGKLQVEGRRFLRSGAFFGAGLIVTLFLSNMHAYPGSLRLLILISVLALPAFTISLFALGQLRISRSEHRFYYPLKILSRVSIGGRTGVLESPASIGVILLVCSAILPALFISSAPGSPIGVAQPVYVPEVESFTRLDIEALTTTEAPGLLTDLSDYLTHRAYQDALLYSKEWVYPSVDAGISITRYQVRNGMVKPSETTVFSLGSEWFEGVMADAAHDGIGSMLLDQGRPVTVVRPDSIESTGILIVRQLGLVAFLLLPLLLLHLNLTTQYFYGMRNLLLRRKRQTA